MGLNDICMLGRIAQTIDEDLNLSQKRWMATPSRQYGPSNIRN